ncbi:Gibberellin 2-beta-dioxygenase, partial [Zea mays]
PHQDSDPNPSPSSTKNHPPNHLRPPLQRRVRPRDHAAGRHLGVRALRHGILLRQCRRRVAGADQRAVPERAAPGDGEQRAAAGVGDLLRRPAAAGAPGAAAGSGGPGGRPTPLQGVHVEGVQELGVPDQAGRQQALLLRDHGDELAKPPR